MIMKLLLGIAIFVIINLLITMLLRYNGNDGWLEVYRRKGGKTG